MVLHFQPILASDYLDIAVFVLGGISVAPGLALTGLSFVVALVPALRTSIRGFTWAAYGVLMVGFQGALLAMVMGGAGNFLGVTQWVVAPLAMMGAIVWGNRWLGLKLLRRARRKKGLDESDASEDGPAHTGAVVVLFLTAVVAALALAWWGM